MRTRAAPVLAALALLACGCTCTAGVTAARDDAERAVTEFHDRFNQGQFDAIWAASGDEMKRAASEQDFTALLTAIRRKLGDVTGSTSRGWNVQSVNLTTYVALQHETTFATGKGVESFRFVVRGGRVALVAYNINSTDLVLR